ncbi:hypothetical protein DUI87_25543 [Hirundo rustica rustica]|uniref:G-protein coupled receptors family 1 profile domain-containing protein n=1 Tax=Hirundo rustica rustica TaxID=333673 RepID=A0A3M0JAV5_HIRRU|nr:hypothetical protein DUI87_25543 [Hirundo rustica rustica]
MEVTTVSPSPASPTEWEDLCETDVTNVAIHSVTLLVCLCGLVGNGAVLLCLLRLKLRNTDFYYLAFADFLFLLFSVSSALLFLVEDVSCSPIMPLMYVGFLFLFSVVFCCWALFSLLLQSNIVYMAKLYKLCCRCVLPAEWLLLVYCAKALVFFALFTVIPTVTNPCPSQQEEPCQAALISVYTLILLLCAAPTVISSTINLIKAKRGSTRQQPKGRDIVNLLLVPFILLLSICNFLHRLGYTLVSSEVLFLLNCIQNSIKPFIYFLAGRCWSPCSMGSFQLSLQRVFDEQEGEAAHSNNASMDTGL